MRQHGLGGLGATLLALTVVLAGCTAAPPSTTSTSTTTTSVPSGGVWQPVPGVSWQWQLTGTIDTSVDADVFDVDLYDVSAATVAELHDKGAKVICYFSAGSWEDWRPDADQFDDDVLGTSNGWPGEQWLDIRRLDVLGPIMEARLDLCAAKGFDAVEPDNIDGYANSTGFDLTYADQLAYNRWLADEAHARGLAIGLKNDVDQVDDLVDDFDFAVNEECFEWDECERLTPFIDQNKAVFHVEYEHTTNQFCPPTTSLGFSSLRKNWDLDAWYQTCP